MGIGGGMESMSLYSMEALFDSKTFDQLISKNPLAYACTFPMGLTSENIAEKFGITRQQQDNFALESYEKAVAAQENG